MGDTIIIETPVATVLEVSGKQGPQGIPGATGATGATGPQGPAGTGIETLTTAGDLLYRDNSAATRLPIGSAGQVLKVSNGLPAWANESGAVTSVNGETGAVILDFAESEHAIQHEAGNADEIQAMAALVTTEDASLNGIYVPNANGTSSGGRLTLYKPGTRENTKLEYNSSLNGWYLIKNTVVQLAGQEENATYAWTPQQWLDQRSPQVLPNGGTVTRAGLEVLARRAADGTSNVAPATTTQDGLLSAADKTKLNNAVETSRTISAGTGLTGGGDLTANRTLSVSFGSSAGTVAEGNDARLSDSRTPTAHASSHASAGSDPLFDQDLNTTDVVEFTSVTTADIFGLGALEALGTGSNFTRVLGDGGLEFGGTNAASARTNLGLAIGTDVAAASHTHAAADITSGTIAHERGGLEADVSAYNGLVKISGGSTSAVGIGTGSTEVAAGDHVHGNLTSDGKLGSTAGLPVVTTTAGAVTTLALGTANQVLRVNSGATGVEFADPSGGGGVSAIGASAADILSVSGSDLVADDPNADRIVFWDDSASALKYLEVSTGLSISGTTLTATGGGGGSKTYAVFSAEHNQPPATAFATLDTRNSIAVLDFDDATDESAVFVSIIPEGASLGSGLKIRLHWMATTATSGNCVWDVSLERMTTDLDSDSFDTIASGTAAANGTSGILTVTEITLTTIDSVTAGDAFRLKVTRDANNASDTMTGDAELVVCEVRSAA